jgi:hypothetical protein
MLACLLDERWLKDGVVDCAGELIYFRCAANELAHSPSRHLILPTMFLSDLPTLFGQKNLSYSLRTLRERLQATDVEQICIPELRNGHYSVYIYDTTVSAVTYFCTVNSQPMPTFCEMLNWVLSGLDEVDYPRPTVVTIGQSPQQPAGSGSCGVAMLNRVSLATNLERRLWSHKRSPLLRKELLGDLITFHLLACETQENVSIL